MNCLTPKTMAEFAEALAQCTEDSVILAGGTDLVIKMRQNAVSPDLMIYPGQIPELRTITLTEQTLRIGAFSTMASIEAALADKIEFGALTDAVSGVGSPQIRSKATIGGNLCSASPAGDLLPVCLLLDARVEILRADGTIFMMPVSDFILAPHKTALRKGEAVIAVVIDLTGFENVITAFQKIGSREYVSIARESAAALLEFSDDDTVLDARITLGAVANTPIRVPEAEKILVGRSLTAETLEELWPILSRMIHDNCRPANRKYKTAAAHGLIADLFAKLEKRI